MTDKQRAFVMEYMVDLNATQAAVRAGYSPNRADSTGSHLLANPSVREAVDNAMAELAEKTGRTALDVLRDIQELTREAREEGDVKTALKGLELEGKHLGMFTGKVENHVSGEVMVQWKQS